jgi:hypothetical protein
MSTHQRSDKYFKWFLIVAFLYFLGHFIVGVANASSAPPPPPPIIQCWNNGFGTIQCIQI